MVIRAVFSSERARSWLGIISTAAVLWGFWQAPGAHEASAQSATATEVALPTCDQISLDALVVALFEDTFDTQGNGGGRPNRVLLKNCNSALKVRGSVQINRIGGPAVEPVNLSMAYGQCIDCQTLAVSLQLNLYRPSATTVMPRNGAAAINLECTRCYTVARALQYSFAVDDPSELPPRLSSLINEMDRQFKLIAQESGSLSLEQAEGKVNYVIQQFQDLAASLDDKREQRTENGPDATATPTPTPMPTATAMATPMPTGTPTADQGTPPVTTTPATPSPVSAAPAPASPTPTATPTAGM